VRLKRGARVEPSEMPRSDESIARARVCYESVERAEGLPVYKCVDNDDLAVRLCALTTEAEASFDDGCCYLQVIKSSWEEVAKAELLSWPTFEQLILYNAAAFDMCACAETSLVSVGNGRYHLSWVGNGSTTARSFLDCVIGRVGGSARSFPATSLGWCVGVYYAARRGPSPELGDRLGGLMMWVCISRRWRACLIMSLTGMIWR